MYSLSTLSTAKPEIERVAVPEIINIRHVRTIQKKHIEKTANTTIDLPFVFFMAKFLPQSTASHSQ
jgi:hypothetical protein